MLDWLFNRKKKLTQEERINMSQFKYELGKEAADIITGFKGTIVARVEYLTGCAQYGLVPKVNESGEIKSAEFFDEGRIQITGDGIAPKEVEAEKRGGISRDMPRI